MQNVSDEYRISMSQDLRERSYCKVMVNTVETETDNFDIDLVAVDDVSDLFIASLSLDEITNLYSSTLFDNHYATLEENFFKLDGTMLWLGDNPAYQEYLICNDVYNTYQLTINYNQYVTKMWGLSFTFPYGYPTQIVLNFYKDDTLCYEYSCSNDSNIWYTDEIFDGFTFNKCVVTFSKMNCKQRLRITEIVLGCYIWDNENIIKVEVKDYMSPVVENLPQRDVTVIVNIGEDDDRFVINNPDGVLQNFISCSKMLIYFGYDVDGEDNIEWITPYGAYLSGWEFSNNQLSLSGTDYLRNLTSTYPLDENGVSVGWNNSALVEYLVDYYEENGWDSEEEFDSVITELQNCYFTYTGYWISMQEMLTKILASANLSDYVIWDSETLNDYTTKGVLENVTYKEVLQLIATLNCSQLIINREGLVEITNPVSTDSLSGISYDSDTEEIVDGFVFTFHDILNDMSIERNSQLYNLNVTYSFRTGVANNYTDYTNFVVALLAYKYTVRSTIYTLLTVLTDIINVIFDTDLEYDDYLDNLGETSLMSSTYYYSGNPDIDEVIYSISCNTSNYLATSFMCVYSFTANALSVSTACTAYGTEYPLSLKIYSDRIDVVCVQNEYENNSISSITLSNIYVLPINNNNKTYLYNCGGNDVNNNVTWETSFCGTETEAKRLAEYLNKYNYSRPYTYTFTCRGFPELDVGDIVYQNDNYEEDMLVQIVEHTLTFNGGALKSEITTMHLSDEELE